jgi:hypothetical protein
MTSTKKHFQLIAGRILRSKARAFSVPIWNRGELVMMTPLTAPILVKSGTVSITGGLAMTGGTYTGAVEIGRGVRQALKDAGIAVAPFKTAN